MHGFSVKKRRRMESITWSTNLVSSDSKRTNPEPGYVSYDPAECLAEVMQSEIYPRILRTVSVT